MKLEDFISETLKQIINGVSTAQPHYSERGGTVNSRNLGYRKIEGTQLFDKNTGQITQIIEFDVAVSTSEGTGSKGGVGVFVGPVSLGSQGSSEATNSSHSRIKFSVPVNLPNG